MVSFRSTIALGVLMIAFAPLAAAEDEVVELEAREVLDCPEPRVEARQDTSVVIEWDDVEGANVYEVRRDPPPVAGGNPVVFTGGGPGFENRFVDITNRPGETFRYRVDAFGPELARSVGCPEVEITAIPSFPTLVAGALALVGGVGALAAARRR